MQEDFFRSLSPEEFKNVKNWFKKFKETDRSNLQNLLTIIDNWASGNMFNSKDWQFFECQWDGATKREKYKAYVQSGNFFSLFAVGSSITSKKDPSDIDLLLITDMQDVTTTFVSPCFSMFMNALNESFVTEINGELCHKYFIAEKECRTKIDLMNKERKGKSIDIIFQYDIYNEARWHANDKFDSVILYRIGRERPTERIARIYIPGKGYACQEIPLKGFYRLSEMRNLYM